MPARTNWQSQKDFIHKETNKLVRTCSVLATEELTSKNMSRAGAGAKTGLTREILSAGFDMVHQMLVQSGRNWYEIAFVQYAPTQAIAALLKALGGLPPMHWLNECISVRTAVTVHGVIRTVRRWFS